MNLPRIALETRGDMAAFWELLDERLEIVHEGLRFREARVRQARPENAPILYKSGGFARLHNGEEVGHLFDHGRATLSLGFIGLYEVAAVFFGRRWETNEQAKQFTLDILAHMKPRRPSGTPPTSAARAAPSPAPASPCTPRRRSRSRTGSPRWTWSGSGPSPT